MQEALHVKFRVDKDLLADSVAWAARTLPSRPSLPQLSCLLVDASSEQLTLSGFDYETSARVTLSAEVSDEGTVLVSGRLLADICRSLPAKPVDVALDGAKVSLTCGSSRFSLQTVPVEDYPTLPELPQIAGTVDADAFAEAVSQSVTAAGRDDMLPVLTGVRVEFEGQTVSLLATDRFRLSSRDLEWRPERTDVSASALVPSRVLSDVAKSLTSGSSVTIALAPDGEGLIGFETGASGGIRRTTTRLIDGTFPNVRQIFPTSTDTNARADLPALVESVKRVALVAGRNTPIRLTFSSDQVATLEAGNGEEAQASESLEAKVDGEEITIGFNPGYLLDGLGAIHAPFVNIGMTQPSRPATFAGVAELDGEPDADFRYLLMPLRIQG
jgi:DNA polymerase-3 subunit beta